MGRRRLGRYRNALGRRAHLGAPHRPWYLAGMSNFLPSDWKDVLGQVGAWFDEAGRTADRRERDFAERFPATPAEPRTELDTARLSELAARMRSLQASAAEAEEAAVGEETQLRKRVERSETLRLRLAERLEPSEPDAQARTRTASMRVK
jgi:hypothetical protein